jgi:hypothetical protein
MTTNFASITGLPLPRRADRAATCPRLPPVHPALHPRDGDNATDGPHGSRDGNHHGVPRKANDGDSHCLEGQTDVDRS